MSSADEEPAFLETLRDFRLERSWSARLEATLRRVPGVLRTDPPEMSGRSPDERTVAPETSGGGTIAEFRLGSERPLKRRELSHHVLSESRLGLGILFLDRESELDSRSTGSLRRRELDSRSTASPCRRGRSTDARESDESCRSSDCQRGEPADAPSSITLVGLESACRPLRDRDICAQETGENEVGRENSVTTQASMPLLEGISEKRARGPEDGETFEEVRTFEVFRWTRPTSELDPRLFYARLERMGERTSGRGPLGRAFEEAQWSRPLRTPRTPRRSTSELDPRL